MCARGGEKRQLLKGSTREPDLDLSGAVSENVDKFANSGLERLLALRRHRACLEAAADQEADGTKRERERVSLGAGSQRRIAKGL
jgi:hypothetical protein